MEFLQQAFGRLWSDFEIFPTWGLLGFTALSLVAGVIVGHPAARYLFTRVHPRLRPLLPSWVWTFFTNGYIAMGGVKKHRYDFKTFEVGMFASKFGGVGFSVLFSGIIIYVAAHIPAGFLFYVVAPLVFVILPMLAGTQIVYRPMKWWLFQVWLPKQPNPDDLPEVSWE